MKKNTANSGLIEIIPGVTISVGSNETVSIPHPDPCFVILDRKQTLVKIMKRNILIFSSKDLARGFMGNGETKLYVIKEYSWNDFVNRFKNEYKYAVVDHKGKAGFYPVVPVQKDI